MRVYSFLIGTLFLFTSCAASAQTTKSIYQLPEASVQTVETAKAGGVIAGASSGLYRLTATKTAIPLWTEGKVMKIIHSVPASAAGETPAERWFFLTSNGVLSSTDLKTFEYRNNGLPFLKLKEVNADQVVFVNRAAQIKDLEIHPENPDILITATKDAVFITYDGGLNWKSLGSSNSMSGIKAVAVCNIEGRLTAFMAHSVYGFSYCYPEHGKGHWNDCRGGFDNMKTQTYPEEIADIHPVVVKNEDGTSSTELYLSQTYIPRLYRFDWASKRGQLLYSGKEPLDTIDGLFWDGNELLFTRPGEIASYNPSSNNLGTVPQSYYTWKNSFAALSPKDALYSAWIPDAKDLTKGISLSELWLLKPNTCTSQYADKALNKKSIYCPANMVTTQEGIEKYKKIILDNKLDSLVIDMKDDYGLLRYDAQDSLVIEKGYVSKYHINLNQFVAEMKKDNIYLIARIVVFKDKHLSTYDGGKYAIWNKKTNRPWMGTKGMEDITDADGNVTGQKMAYYDENWVDQYSPEVWEYNVHIARELISRGFDEIQFDYIRFPTDGRNMADSYHRWQDPGMDKESALLSFLSYARKNIDAPIGIDIYGQNGWHRSGTSTGQEVELLSDYVDVICPMFYPSHFGNDFLEYAPVSERPYRIYYYGTYRNSVISRNKTIIRPWLQAFYLPVRYDKQWYNTDYVQKQVFGVRDSVNRGYMYWNNIGRYGDILPDPGSSAYKGPAPEASNEFRKPALGSGNLLYPQTVTNDYELKENNENLSMLDTVRTGSFEEKTQTSSVFPSISDIRKLWQAYESDKHEI